MMNLVEEGVDAAVRIRVLEDSTYVARQVGATRRVVVGSPEYLATRKSPRSPDALDRHDLIRLSTLTPTREWRFVCKGEERGFAVAARYVTNSAEFAIVHAEKGGGLAMMLSYQVVESVPAGRLEVVLRRFETPPRPIQIVYPSTRLLSAKVRAFVDFVLATCDWSFADL